MPYDAKNPVVDESFIEAFSEALQQHDFEAIREMLTDDAVMESAFGPEERGRRFVGKDAFCAGLQRYLANVADIVVLDRAAVVFGDHGFCETTVTYTGPDGRPIRTVLCDIYSFRDGRMSSKRAYRKQPAPL